MTNTDLTVRLRLEGSELSIEAAAAVEHLRECLAFAQQALAIVKGTLEVAHDEDGVPFRVEHNIPPSAPPHDE